MTTQLVSSLRKKYYAGDASLEEEKLLKQLLEAHDAPAEWKAEAELMQILSTPAEVAPPPGFEQRLLKRLQQEQGWKASTRQTNAFSIFKRIALTTAVAACMAGFFFALDYYSKPAITIYMDTCQNADEATKEVENALLLVANTLSFDELDDELGGPCE